VRAVDLPRTVAEELKRHIAEFPSVEVELPWGRPDADKQRKKVLLLLTARHGNALAANAWNTCTWKPALAKGGVIPPRAEGAKRWQWAAAR
jgi:hypothetical protein